MHGLIPGLFFFFFKRYLGSHIHLELFRFIAGFGVYATGQMLEGRSGPTLQEGSQSCSEWNSTRVLLSPFFLESKEQTAAEVRVNEKRTVSLCHRRAAIKGSLTGSPPACLRAPQAGGCHDTWELCHARKSKAELFGGQTTSDRDAERGAFLLTERSMGKPLQLLISFSEIQGRPLLGLELQRVCAVTVPVIWFYCCMMIWQRRFQ